MRALLLAALVPLAALAQAPEATTLPETVAVATPAKDGGEDFDPPWSCAKARQDAQLEGPVALGFFEADLATGRRVCPRTELGLGGRFAATIDTPNFYGDLGIDGVLFGSYALNSRTELFGHLEAVQYTYVQNASLKGSTLTLGNLTVGATRIFEADREAKLRHGVSARVLLPTAFNIPGAHLMGAELGHVASWRQPGALRWLEVHSYLGVNLTGAIGQVPPIPFVTGTLLLGAQLSPWDWVALALDLDGRLGVRSSLAPAFALRFRVFRASAEVAVTLPLVGSDRHDLVAGLRFAYGF